MNAAAEFLRRAAGEAADTRLRDTVRHNIASYSEAVVRGKLRFADWESARTRAQEIKREAISNLDRYLEAFEAKIIARGGHVFWAEDAASARAYICGLASKRAVRNVVKSKSMVTEEIDLRPELQARGINVVETDLGEYIVQLRNEPPYHILTPAMHLTRNQVAELFRDKIDPAITTDNPPELVAVARKKLRAEYFAADMGITGANFLVAEEGMVAISTNEGNGRLTVGLPRVHVVVAGIEKIVPRLSDLAVLWPVLATAGTGQAITTYGTLIGGPQNSNEHDGPEEFHIVLLDNGRTDFLADLQLREVLHCIRCGACLNVCPVYKTIGGHAYRTTYQGPIGSVLSPHLRGMDDKQHLPFASTLCGACGETCPVRIDLPRHLLEIRHNQRATKHASLAERAAFRMWRWTVSSGSRFRCAGLLSRKLIRLAQTMGIEGLLRAWTRYRAQLAIPKESFRELWRNGRV